MKKNILVLTPRLPYPLIGGDKLRIYHICKDLSRKGHSVTLISFVQNRDEETYATTHEDASIFKQIIPVMKSKSSSYVSSVMGIAGTLPLQVYYYSSKRMCEAVQQAVASDHFDAIICHLIRMAPYSDLCPYPVMKILEMTDALSLNYLRNKKIKRMSLFNIIYRFEYSRVVKFEDKYIQRFDNTVLVSESDKSYLIERNHAVNVNVRVIPLGINPDLMRVKTGKIDPNLIVFIGNMRSFQNNDAVLYFIEKIYPLIKQKKPGSIFRVVGAEPSKSVLKHNNTDGIEITGKVPDIISCVRDACVSVCPVRIKSGMQFKILESMALGIPVITTPEGLQGISAHPGKDLVVAENERSYAECVVRIMNDSDLREQLVQNGRKLINDHYQWDSKLEDYERIIKGLTK